MFRRNGVVILAWVLTLLSMAAPELMWMGEVAVATFETALMNGILSEE